MRVVLHAGCGAERLPHFVTHDKEVRLDIDPRSNPDIVASMTDLGDIGPFDGVYAYHALEHLMPHDAIKALEEFRRVLKPGGYVMVFVPDLEDVRPTTDVLYVSDSGPMCGLDLYYGCSRMLVEAPYMAHRTGFTSESLRDCMTVAGLTRIHTQRLENYNLMGIGFA